MQILFWTATVITFAMFATFVSSHFDLKRRLNVLEQQQQYFAQRENFQLGTIKRIKRDHSMLRLREHGNMADMQNQLTKMKMDIELEKYLDANGRPDYALESSGARILSIGSTQWVSKPTNKLQTMKTIIFGCSTVNSPRYLIQASNMPGECFAFTGPGEVTIELVKPIVVDAVSVEHILAESSPEGDISNAPKEFSVFGLVDVDDAEPERFGDFTYNIASEWPLQLFPITNHSPFPIVKFQIHSNHGHVNNTCVYRLRVHGRTSP